jgi:UDP-GlcNAc:undecaprenyl-phosphate GlcNAc-1-phosphate transferase
MIFSDNTLYLLCFLTALCISGILTPAVRLLAVKLNILDHPVTEIKTHKNPVPYLGGVAVAVALAVSLLFVRFLTNFPTGTLRSLRGIFYGTLIIFLTGLADDIHPRGLGYRKKFVLQFLAAFCLLFFDIRIKFISPAWFADILTVIWVVGITNALNIVDIMDGLSSGIGIIASLAFLFISLPSEEIYVNFTAAALAGALAGFLPFNLSRRLKIFLGDTGSLVNGFVLAALSLGTSYTRTNNLGVFAPIFILGLPLYDTFLVIYLRFMKGQSPFLGSKDHFALRLEAFGFLREEILVISYAAAMFLAFAAYEVTVVRMEYAAFIYALAGLAALYVGTWLARINIDG